MIQIRSATVLAGTVVVALGLGACTSASVESDDAASTPAVAQTEAPATSEPGGDKETATDEDGAKSAPGSYIEYADYVKNPDKFKETDVVLFFHAAWCTTCHAAEESIQNTGVSDGLTIVKVDYDSSQDLKQKHGVTLQHTFIQVDGDGQQKAKFVGQITVDDIVAQLA